MEVQQQLSPLNQMSYEHAVKWEPTLHSVAKKSALAGVVCLVAFVALAELSRYIWPGANEEGSNSVKNKGCLENIYKAFNIGVGCIGSTLIPVACTAKLAALVYTTFISRAEELMNQS